MVNASLNWASIVGIVLAVCGAGLYFLRSFKPALARDYDVFFAAIGLLCGGILFFQGWRLDPILQFGQFLLAGTTVFFAYESVRLRGIATDQARRSSYFDDEPEPSRVGSGGMRRGWDDSYEQFNDGPPSRRRFASGDYSYESDQEGDAYRQRRISRRAIPEEAESRRNSRENQSWDSQKSDSSRRMARFGSDNEEIDNRSTFGQRRNLKQEQKKGTRPISNRESVSRRRVSDDGTKFQSISKGSKISGQSSMGRKTEDAAFYPASGRRRSNSKSNNSRRNEGINDPRSRSSSSNTRSSQYRNTSTRDNSSRFDD